MLIFNKIQSSFVILQDSFKNFLKGSTDVQDALERIDNKLIPATQEADGLLLSTDKIKIDEFISVTSTEKYKLENLETVVANIINNSKQMICQSSYIHTQPTSSYEWVVNHNLDTRDIIYMVYNSFGEAQHAPIEFIDNNSFRLVFTDDVSGRAVVLGGVDSDCVDSISFIDTFNNLLAGTTTLQSALEKIDTFLIPATYQRDGTFSASDKLKLDTLQETVEDGGIGHISLTSGYGTYSFESNTIEDEYTINHKLNSYNLTITIMYMNDDGYWENLIAPITFLDENTIYIKLVEAKEIIVHINAVEYFFSYTYESTENKLVHEITHNLKSYNLLFNIIVYDLVDSVWKNDLAKFVYKDENTGILTLTDASPCRVNFIRL